MSQSDNFVDPDAVHADLADFLDAVGHEPLTVRMNHATWEITRDGERYAVDCYGRGGGWYASRSMSRRELRAYLASHEELELKRPASQRPD